jgi:hypothetical protein
MMQYNSRGSGAFVGRLTRDYYKVANRITQLVKDISVS